jgi:hypothetical protein
MLLKVRPTDIQICTSTCTSEESRDVALFRKKNAPPDLPREHSFTVGPPTAPTSRWESEFRRWWRVDFPSHSTEEVDYFVYGYNAITLTADFIARAYPDFEKFTVQQMENAGIAWGFHAADPRIFLSELKRRNDHALGFLGKNGSSWRAAYSAALPVLEILAVNMPHDKLLATLEKCRHSMRSQGEQIYR